MGRLRTLCAAGLAVMASKVVAASMIEATNATSTPDEVLVLMTSDGQAMSALVNVTALTSAAEKDIPPPGLTGSLYLANTTSTLDVTSRDIAVIGCDAVPGELQAPDVFTQAVSANASAVLFYSLSSEGCRFVDYVGAYGWAYTTLAKTDAEMVLNRIQQGFDNNDPVWAQIALRDSTPGAEGNGTGGRDLGSHAGDNDDNNDNNQDGRNNDQQDQNALGPSPTTAVAMIILYSITGIITALFLVIIITGALRAHRHPERYGPRNIVGRPRQSRAKGIARAMLDTLPIVKFGQRNEEPKPTDVELAENRPESSDTQNDTTRATDTTPAQPNNTTQATDAPAPRRQSTTSQSGIAAAVTGTRRDSHGQESDNMGCSICTEDFTEGQDQRVLPCDHRFHPECVDPWLLNVSGTCPLCRIDLHPPADEQELDEHGEPIPREVDENGNPIAGEAGEQREVYRMSVRRSLLIGLLGSRSVDRLSREERLAALRQYGARRRAAREAREANAAADATATASPEAQAEEAEPQEDPSRTRNRLTRMFGVRTRRTEGRDPSDQSRS